MATSVLCLFILSTILSISFAHPNTLNPPHPREKEKTLLVVEGMVYCQSCAHIGSWSLTGARPLPSAKVGISCRDHKNRVGFYKSVKADNNGYFYCPLEGLEVKRYYKGEFARACTVKLLSSPNGECNLLTNINGGIEGSALRDVNKTVVGKGYKAVVYSTGPLAFRPGRCPPLVHY